MQILFGIVVYALFFVAPVGATLLLDRRFPVRRWFVTVGLVPIIASIYPAILVGLTNNGDSIIRAGGVMLAFWAFALGIFLSAATFALCVRT